MFDLDEYFLTDNERLLRINQPGGCQHWMNRATELW